MNDGKPLISRVQKVVRRKNMQVTFSHPAHLEMKLRENSDKTVNMCKNDAKLGLTWERRIRRK